MKRTVLVCVLIGLGAPALLFVCLLLGPSGIGLPNAADETGRAILMLRINRVATGFIVGAALSCAGVVFQAILRNPLAEPYVLGVSSGAGLGAAAAILTGFSAWSVFALPLTAFIGGAATLAIVYLLASEGGVPSIYGLILSGVIVSAICSSVLMFLVAAAPAEGLHSVLWWMLGNLQPSSTALLRTAGVLVGGGIAALWLISPELNAMTLGRETAHHVGVRTQVLLFLSLGLATLIAASAVALGGLIGFVGLIVPHATRAVVGPGHRRLIPAAALAGGVFLALCDALARTVMRPVEIPVGVITAVCGGPFFLVILRSRIRRAWIS